jgi:hypothetical protein
MACREPGALRWSLCVTAGAIHSTALIERSALDEVGGYAQIPTSADLAMWCAFARRGWLAVLAEPLVHYRVHPSQITSARTDEQRSWGTSVLAKHLEALTGEPWPAAVVRALRATGRWEDAPFAEGVRALDRWERCWRKDASLDPADRRALARLTGRVRVRHWKTNGNGPLDLIATGVAMMRPRYVPLLTDRR